MKSNKLNIRVITEELNRKYHILKTQLQELQADLEDLSDEDIIDCREVMLQRVNVCLEEIGEFDEDN